MQGSYDDFKREVFQLIHLDLSAYKERQMKRRIDALIDKHKYSSYSEFLAAIKVNKALLDEFVNYLTINVSEFYRNPEQWAILENEILMAKLKSETPLKIWSAACSTGEEPYSLVMLLSKYMPLNKIKIIATDLDEQVLEKAQIGVYNEKFLKALPEEFKTKYFTYINDKNLQISPTIKKQVEFRKHDLLKDPYPKDCDLIVCRNVMIYFTEEAKSRIYIDFYNALSKGGCLFIGSTEQIIQASDIGFISYKSFFYLRQE